MATTKIHLLPSRADQVVDSIIELMDAEVDSSGLQKDGMIRFIKRNTITAVSLVGGAGKAKEVNEPTVLAFVPIGAIRYIEVV